MFQSLEGDRSRREVRWTVRAVGCQVDAWAARKQDCYLEATYSEPKGGTSTEMHEQMPMTKQRLQEVFDAYKLHPEFLGLSLEDVNQRGALDSTLLHIASRTGNVSHIKALIDAGADINAKGDLDNTPLHEAALCGQAQAAEVLLSLGADPTCLNEFQQTAYEVATLGKKGAVAELIRKFRAGR